MLFVTLLVGSGSQSAYGVLLPVLEAEFGVSRVASSIVMLLYLIAVGLWNVLAGWFTGRFGSRRALYFGYVSLVFGFMVWSLSTQVLHLYLIHGVVISFGTVFLSLTVLSPMISHRFVRRSGLALGLVSTGFSLGQLVTPPALAALTTVYEWRLALGYLGLAIGLVGLFTSAVVSLSESRVNSSVRDVDAGEQVPGSDAIKKAVYFSSAPYFVCGFTDFLITTHLVAYATSFKIELTAAALSLSLIGAFNIPALVVLGLFADRVGAAPSLTVTYAIRFTSFLILLFADNLLTLYLFAAIFGLTYYTTAPLAAKLVFSGYGSRQGSKIYGLLVLLHMVGGAAGALFGGIIYDAYLSYQPAFLISTALLATAVLISYYAQKISESRLVST